MKLAFHAISIALAAALLSGCASVPETSRSAVGVQVPQSASISTLQRRFQAETPYIVNFGFDDDNLDQNALSRLDIQAAWILAHPNVKFRVYGHTDRVGGVAYNADLGLRRAKRVVGYLIGKGIEPARLEAVVSFGEDAPVIDTNDREPRNRRVETAVHEYIAPLPRFEIRDGDTVRALFTTDGSGPDTTTVSTSDPAPASDPAPSPSDENGGSSKKPNSGRGNGDEGGDPGKSEGKNNGGDI